MAEAVRSPRERYREQVRDEIKAHAWAQVATAGASALSLNAVAREMGISGPALYRYVRNRDDLLTELVLDAYRDLLRECRAAVAGEPDPRARLVAAAFALRAWARAEPHRYLLIYGTPVPGYHAPPEATEAAAGLMAVLLDAFDDAEAARPRDPAPARGRGGGVDPEGVPPAGGVPAPARRLEQHLAERRAWAGDHPASAGSLRRALAFWTRLHGVLSLEVAGHFAGMGFDPALLYSAEVDGVIPPVT